jgi:6-phosphogluconolactonase
MSADQRSTPDNWTRREFVRGAAGVLALAHLPHAMATRLESHFVYVAAGEDDGPGAIHVLHIQDGTSSQVQRFASRAPAHLLLSAAQQVLYVANDIEKHEGQPRGTVEAFRVHPIAGTLTLLSRTPLSLSATRPQHMALSPDGKWLAVAAYAGGIYNVLPVAEDGSLGAARGIFKDAGSGPHPQWQASAHPHTIVFDEAGRHLLSSDFGSEQLNVFAIDAGRLRRVSQRATRAGSGPASCVLHPAGFLYAAHALAGSLAGYRYDAASGAVTELPAPLAQPRCAALSLALHPAGHTLYAADAQTRTLGVWHIDQQSGRLGLQKTVPLDAAKPTHLTVAADGRSLYIVSSSQGSVIRFMADAATGQLYARAELATIPSPRSIAIRTT